MLCPLTIFGQNIEHLSLKITQFSGFFTSNNGRFIIYDKHFVRTALYRCSGNGPFVLINFSKSWNFLPCFPIYFLSVIDFPAESFSLVFNNCFYFSEDGSSIFLCHTDGDQMISYIVTQALENPLCRSFSSLFSVQARL